MTFIEQSKTENMTEPRNNVCFRCYRLDDFLQHQRNDFNDFYCP